LNYMYTVFGLIIIPAKLSSNRSETSFRRISYTESTDPIRSSSQDIQLRSAVRFDPRLSR
jgi:hypothetical protein